MQKLKQEKYLPAKAYIQHGFSPEEVTDSQIFGQCPFCGKKNKFYMHKTSKLWDCKACGKSGGFKTFLQEMTEANIKGLTKEKAKELEKKRSIPVATLKEFNVGYNSMTRNFTIPVYAQDGKTVIDIRRYALGRLISTATCRTGLLNSHKITKDKKTVYLCEGEWDAMALHSFLNKNKMEGVVVSVPGANVLKPEWVQVFQGKSVKAMYDYDNAGKEGSVRAFNTLTPVAKDIRFLHWTEDKADGYDVRDLINSGKSHAEIIKYLQECLMDTPTGKIKDTGLNNGGQYKITYDGEGCKPQEIYDVFEKWLYIPDTDVIDAIFGTIFANRLEGDPLWLFLIAPPGMTKTTFLQALGTSKGMEAVSTLTPHSLVSGASVGNGGDPSLIARLDGKMLIIKDFTTILTMNQQAREEIFGLLRDAYDREITKVFGNGIVRKYENKFGIIAGVTPIIETFLDQESALGERFLRFTMTPPVTVEEQLYYLRKASENSSHEETMKAEMRNISKTCINYAPEIIPAIPEAIEEKVWHLAILVSMSRGTVQRDRITKEILAQPFTEVATRISKQFLRLMQGIAIFHKSKKVTTRHFEVVKKIARSTIPHKMNTFLYAIYKNKMVDEFEKSELIPLIKIPSSMIPRQLENMCLLDLIEKSELSKLKILYKIKESVYNLMKTCEIYK